MALVSARTLARVEQILRPILSRLPPEQQVKLYSKGRQYFLKAMSEDVPKEVYHPPQDLARTLWGIHFQSPIMNAAGMFKNGECYEVVARQGAGAYLGGTGTWNARPGNSRNGIHLPFVPYRESHAASNWLGLPNEGDMSNASRLRLIKRMDGCPIGWSVMGSPDYDGVEKLKHLADGLWAYARAGVNFLEINESCPNTTHGKPQDDNLASRLGYIKEHFLDQRDTRKWNIPVIVKFSNDTNPLQVPALIELLVGLGFDGVNFGNTSTLYDERKKFIDQSEQESFTYFTSTFGGGVSGRPLKESSLNLAKTAVGAVQKIKPDHEFHVIRTGGIESLEEVMISLNEGVSLVQWYTGYFEGFKEHGHDVYRQLFSER